MTRPGATEETPKPIEAAELSNGRLTARVIDFGASLVDLRLDGIDFPLILGLAHLADYPRHGLLFGAIVGRNANRIAGARARIDGVAVALEANEDAHHLHGGANGFALRRWRLHSVSPTAVICELTSPDGEAGFPGRLEVTARYEIVDPAILRLSIEAHADRTTIVNLCHHPYFNLDGSADAARHELTIAADRYLPSGDDLIPTGEIAAVAGTRFDFRTPRRPAEMPRRAGEFYNHNFCLAERTREEPAFAACLTGAGGVSMELWTTQTGLHFYEGYKVIGCPPGLDGRRYGPGAGLCLEAQNWPDSPNHPAFPSAILPAGRSYRQVTEYRFSVSRPNPRSVN